MLHCHNLIQEGSGMTAAFNITILSEFGYNEIKSTDLMEERWRAKGYVMADLRTRAGTFSDSALENVVQSMAAADP
ncbi:multicopper oxidase [Colletotrichum orchidophilum]|uniref:Multicopper oxidase n=1 Tax=Colletotrichum orchidophilum TaxID=1209926 RepID=A0A1G4AVF9_9PEZI|nr:multicopper oxidase [Colletotrichum orchidophilum]OHE93134.1 multicopper oxidase [Colletotrichum orchidophilum]